MSETSLTEIILKLLDERQAEDNVSYNVWGKSPLSDYVIISTGKNARHLNALSGDLEKLLFEHGYELKSREGQPESGWILLDFNDIIIHLFDQKNREFYSLERLYHSDKE